MENRFYIEQQREQRNVRPTAPLHEPSTLVHPPYGAREDTSLHAYAQENYRTEQQLRSGTHLPERCCTSCTALFVTLSPSLHFLSLFNFLRFCSPIFFFYDTIHVSVYVTLFRRIINSTPLPTISRTIQDCEFDFNYIVMHYDSDAAARTNM